MSGNEGDVNENNSHTPGPSSRLIPQLAVEENDTCHHCNGFYGPTYGDPLCRICHDFLYTEDFDISQSLLQRLHGDEYQLLCRHGLFQQTHPTDDINDDDDGDSGNDEPSEDVPPPPIPQNQLDDYLHVVRLNHENRDVVDGAEIEEQFHPRLIAVANEGLLEQPLPPNDEEEDEGEEEGNDPEPSSSSDNEDDLVRQFPQRDLPMNIDVDEDQQHLRQERDYAEMERIARRLALVTEPMPSHELTPNMNLTNVLPPEVWRIIFQDLDPVSLILASRVEYKWKYIIRRMVPESTWKEYTKTLWPLFKPSDEVQSWYAVLVTLLSSLSCVSCWIRMHNPPFTLPAPDDDILVVRTLRSVRLSKEIKWITSDHPDGIEAIPLDAFNYNWLARIAGPPKSPYQDGVFYLNIKIPHDYPLQPPLVRFLTKVYHPNISRHGDIGIDCIQHNWTLALMIPQTLLSVQSLLTDPCTEPSMEPSIAKQYIHDRRSFDTTAKIWTWKYARTDALIFQPFSKED